MASAFKSAVSKVASISPLRRILDKTKAKRQGDLEVEDISKLAKSGSAVYDTEPAQFTPEELDKICNISRLRKQHENRVKGIMPPIWHKRDYAKSLLYQRKRYARYGSATGIEPGKLWPTSEELEKQKFLARLRTFPDNPDAIHAEVKRITDQEAERLRQIRARDEEVASKIHLIEEMKEKILKDVSKLEAELDLAEEKRNKRIEQVRRHFQYALSVKDPRFKEKMIEMMQEERDKARKEAKAAKKLKLEAKKAENEQKEFEQAKR